MIERSSSGSELPQGVRVIKHQHLRNSQTPSCLLCNAKMEAGRSLATRDYASRIASWRFVPQMEHDSRMAMRGSVLCSH